MILVQNLIQCPESSGNFRKPANTKLVTGHKLYECMMSFISPLQAPSTGFVEHRPLLSKVEDIVKTTLHLWLTGLAAVRTAQVFFYVYSCMREEKQISLATSWSVSDIIIQLNFIPFKSHPTHTMCLLSTDTNCWVVKKVREEFLTPVPKLRPNLIYHPYQSNYP